MCATNEVGESQSTFIIENNEQFTSTTRIEYNLIYIYNLVLIYDIIMLTFAFFKMGVKILGTLWISGRTLIGGSRICGQC
jgi:hypothetical protein